MHLPPQVVDQDSQLKCSLRDLERRWRTTFHLVLKYEMELAQANGDSGEAVCCL